MNAPPLPGSVTIAGATVDRSKFVNGNFELTDELCNDKPVYRKKGDSTTWLEAVKTNAGTWRWYVKPTSARGPDSSVCFGYGTCETLKDPHECESWYVYDDSKFVLETGVTCVLEPRTVMDGNSSSTALEMDIDVEMDMSEPEGEHQPEVRNTRTLSEDMDHDFDFEVQMPEDMDEVLPDCPETPAS